MVGVRDSYFGYFFGIDGYKVSVIVLSYDFIVNVDMVFLMKLRVVFC